MGGRCRRLGFKSVGLNTWFAFLYMLSMQMFCFPPISHSVLMAVSIILYENPGIFKIYFSFFLEIHVLPYPSTLNSFLLSFLRTLSWITDIEGWKFMAWGLILICRSIQEKAQIFVFLLEALWKTCILWWLLFFTIFLLDPKHILFYLFTLKYLCLSTPHPHNILLWYHTSINCCVLWWLIALLRLAID